MATIRTTYKYACDLDKGTYEVNLRTPLMQADSMADAFQVAVTRNGADVDVSGMNAYGYLYVAANQTTIALKGTVSGNTAEVVLTSDCYAVPGYASLVIQLHEGDVRHAVLKVNLYIERTGSNRVLTGGDVLPTLAELLGQISAMEQATATANETIATIKADTAAAIKATNEATAATQTATVELALTAAPAIECEASGDIISISDGAERPAVSLVSYIDPVQEGSGDPSPDNVRPISGWDKVVVWRTGKNLAQPVLGKETPKTNKGITYCRNADDSVSLEGTATGNVYVHICNARVKEGVAYKMKGISGASATTYQLYTDSEFIKLYPGDGVKSATAVKDGVTTIHFAICEGTTIDMTIYPQFEIGGNVTVYEPYQGQTLTADLPETVYGGTLDWGTGVLTVDRGIVDLGTLNWGYLPAYLCFTAEIPSQTTSILKTGLCAVYNQTDNWVTTSAWTNGNNIFTLRGEDKGIRIKDTRFGNVDAFVAAVTGIQFVYGLATPYTIQLTPQQLETLKGYNNVWSDTGDTDLTYIADTQMYIDNKFNELNAALLSTGANV